MTDRAAGWVDTRGFDPGEVSRLARLIYEAGYRYAVEGSGLDPDYAVSWEAADPSWRVAAYEAAVQVLLAQRGSRTPRPVLGIIGVLCFCLGLGMGLLLGV